jgi:hypothetical protein
MSEIPPPYATRSKSSATISGKLVSGNSGPSDSASEINSQANDKDYRVGLGDSNESEESSPSSDADLYSDTLDQDRPDRPKCKAGPLTAKNKLRSPNSRTNIRSIQAAMPQGKDTLNDIPQQVPGGFKFLLLESYTCHCANPSFLQPSPPQCKVLSYFALVFQDSLQVVYCPGHNQIIPMSEWATHVKGSHLDWSSQTKKSDCTEMAKHVAHSHNLSMDQTAEDLNLPNEIEEPLSANTSKLNLNYLCPLGCGTWVAEDKGSKFPDRFMRQKHIQNNCQKGQCSEYKVIPLDEPRWVFKVQISAKKIKFHCFVLPLGWERSDDEELPVALDAPLLDHGHNAPPSEGLDGRQKWPLTLGWCAYDQEISANDHVVALRSLILLPRCNCRCNASSPNSHFLEKGLHLVDHAIGRYLRSAVSFIHEKHKGVLDAITLECVVFNSVL